MVVPQNTGIHHKKVLQHVTRLCWSSIDLLKETWLRDVLSTSSSGEKTVLIGAYASQARSLSAKCCAMADLLHGIFFNFLLNKFPASTFGKMEHHSEVRTLWCKLMVDVDVSVSLEFPPWGHI